MELPTPLHFAAKYGLGELTSRLLDLPDAIHASVIANSDGHIPEDLARAAKRHSLAAVLENFREVVSLFSTNDCTLLSVCLSVCSVCLSVCLPLTQERNKNLDIELKIKKRNISLTRAFNHSLSELNSAGWTNKNGTLNTQYRCNH